MFTKGKLLALENQIDQARNQKQWPLLLELIKKYSKSNPDTLLEVVVKAEICLSGVSKERGEQERYELLIREQEKTLADVRDDPEQSRRFREQMANNITFMREHHEQGNIQLAQARQLLEQAKKIDPNNKEVLAIYGRLEYETNDPVKALEYLELFGNPFDSGKNFTTHQTKIFLEAFLIRGWCEERANHHERAYLSYNLLLSLAEQTFSGNLSHADSITRPIIEQALLRRALLRHPSIGKTVDMLRRCLTAPIELSANTSQRALKVLAKVLLRDTSLSTYQPIHPADLSSVSSSSNNGTQDPNSSQNMYTPQDETEEALLALVHLEKYISNSSLSSEDLLTFDEMCLGYARKLQYRTIVDVYERSLSYQFRDIHQWLQLALALISSGHYWRGMLILSECLVRDPLNPQLLLLAAKLCINHLNRIHDGIEFCHRSIESIAGSSKFDDPNPLNADRMWLAKTYQLLGISYSKKAIECKSYSERQEFQELALMSLSKAFKLDPRDAKCAYHLALLYADIRDIPKGIKYTKVALGLDHYFSDAWNLLALLISSNKQYKLSHKICLHALKDDPSNINLLITKAKLELALDESASALHSYKTAFAQFSVKVKNLPIYLDSESIQKGKIHSGPSSTHSFDTMSETSRISAAKRNVSFDVAESEEIGSGGPNNDKTKGAVPSLPSSLINQKVQLWLYAAEAFTNTLQFADAIECLQEAKSLAPSSPDIFYYEGLLLERQELLSDAIGQYQKALSIDCHHILSTIRMAMFYQRIHANLSSQSMLGNPSTSPNITSSSPKSSTLTKSQIQVIPTSDGKDKFSDSGSLFPSQTSRTDNREAALLAENYLTSALRSDPTCHQAWFELGLVLKQNNDNERASECFLRAIELDKTTPVIPFSSIPREVL